MAIHIIIISLMATKKDCKNDAANFIMYGVDDVWISL